MLFLDRPVDLDALTAVLATFASGPHRPETDLLVAELAVLVDEARRSFSPAEWDERILQRWAALELAVRQLHSEPGD